MLVMLDHPLVLKPMLPLAQVDLLVPNMPLKLNHTEKLELVPELVLPMLVHKKDQELPMLVLKKDQEQPIPVLALEPKVLTQHMEPHLLVPLLVLMLPTKVLVKLTEPPLPVLMEPLLLEVKELAPYMLLAQKATPLLVKVLLHSTVKDHQEPQVHPVLKYMVKLALVLVVHQELLEKVLPKPMLLDLPVYKLLVMLLPKPTLLVQLVLMLLPQLKFMVQSESVDQDQDPSANELFIE